MKDRKDMKEGYEGYEGYEGSERYGYEGSDISVQLTMIQSLISVLLMVVSFVNCNCVLHSVCTMISLFLFPFR